MKLKLLLLNFLFVGIGWGQFYPVPETVLKAQDKFGDFSNSLTTTVYPFSISELVTIEQYQNYLNAVKRDSGLSYYESQLPASGQFTKDLLNEILSNPNLKNSAMPGVSWSAAKNYCKWLRALAEKDGINYTFELPMLSEILAYEQIYNSDKDAPKNLLESWTLTAYDESTITIIKSALLRDYVYDAKENDPPSMKRKVIYGGSYQMNYSGENALHPLKYEYQDSSSRYVGFRVVRKLGKNKSPVKFYGDNQIVYISDNKLDHIYAEHYASGQLKTLGAFYLGQRVGVWTVWDERGEKKVQRAYWGNSNFSFEYPISDHPLKDVYDKYPAFNLKRNEDNIYGYEHLEERAYVYSKRLFRELNKKNEAQLFKQVNFKQVILDLSKIDIKWYHYGKDGQFKTLVTGDTLAEMKKTLQTWDFDRIEIKEDYFFSSDNLMGDARQISLNFYQNKGDKKPSYSVYYPEIRPHLTKYKVNISSVNDVQHLDDVFYFNEYRGRITKETNILNRDAKPENDWKIEISRLQAEHDLWMSYGR